MPLQELAVDLRRPPNERWSLTPAQCEQARELGATYTADLGSALRAAESLLSAAKDLVSEEYWAEMESLAQLMATPVSDVVLCNCYYDALKVVLSGLFGCTAFAVDTPNGVLHARNLDWWTENSALARFTTICRFVGGAAGDFTTVGWPSFIGAFSGIAPGRFAVTLNAVLSLEPPQFATPVIFLLRRVLEEARSFEDALVLLSETPLPCDCLLLLTGTQPGQMIVIERTPTRHALRRAQDGYICVTNGYRQLDVGTGSAPSELTSTWRQRFERIDALIRGELPRNAERCLEYLSDPEVRMGVTVQQMVFCAATGERWVQPAFPVDSWR